MNEQKVSILVPVYGVEKYIERCAVSLMEQTYANIEYIFVDDATRDRSIAILESVIEKYPERKNQVRILHHKSNKGLSAARNTAIEAATGDYFWHVDSDDYVAIGAVEQLVKKADETNADIVIFDAVEVNENREKILRAEYKEKTSYIKGVIQHIHKCAHWNKFYRTGFYKETGVNSIEHIRLAEDYAVTPRLLHQAKIIDVLHEPLYYYETGNQNSYVHNMTRASVESQHEADKVLKYYFENVADREKWEDVTRVLMQRSIVSLVKRSERETWKLIREVYADETIESGKGMMFINRFIFNQYKAERYGLLGVFIKIYRILICLK